MQKRAPSPPPPPTPPSPVPPPTHVNVERFGIDTREHGIHPADATVNIGVKMDPKELPDSEAAKTNIIFCMDVSSHAVFDMKGLTSPIREMEQVVRELQHVLREYKNVGKVGFMCFSESAGWSTSEWDQRSPEPGRRRGNEQSRADDEEQVQEYLSLFKNRPEKHMKPATDSWVFETAAHFLRKCASNMWLTRQTDIQYALKMARSALLKVARPGEHSHICLCAGTNDKYQYASTGKTLNSMIACPHQKQSIDISCVMIGHMPWLPQAMNIVGYNGVISYLWKLEDLFPCIMEAIVGVLTNKGVFTIEADVMWTHSNNTRERTVRSECMGVFRENNYTAVMEVLIPGLPKSSSDSSKRHKGACGMLTQRQHNPIPLHRCVESEALRSMFKDLELSVDVRILRNNKIIKREWITLGGFTPKNRQDNPTVLEEVFYNKGGVYEQAVLEMEQYNSLQRNLESIANLDDILHRVTTCMQFARSKGLMTLSRQAHNLLKVLTDNKSSSSDELIGSNTHPGRMAASLLSQPMWLHSANTNSPVTPPAPKKQVMPVRSLSLIMEAE